MSDREVMERLFDALCLGLADSEFTVLMTGGRVYVFEGDNEWCLSVFPRIALTPA